VKPNIIFYPIIRNFEITKYYKMDYHINYPDLKAVSAIAASIIFYYLYYYIVAAKKTGSYFSLRWNGGAYYKRLIIFNRVTGFIFLGIIPGYIFFSTGAFSLLELGISYQKIADNWYWLIGLPIVVIIINSITARNPVVYKQYPHMRISNWSKSAFLLNILGWSLYLVGYEFLFRGILLIICTQAFGPWPAIAINISIYSAIHMTQGMKEAIGAIPFGFIVCLFMLNTGTILIPIVLHISQSLSNDYFSIRYNPEMKFIKSRRS
jgi:membrane protease YdiL (CAAX protease family)